MSNRAARIVRALLWATLAAGAIIACANAGIPSAHQGDDDDDAPKDAPPSTNKDAPLQIDASLTDASAIDAPPPIDAAMMPDASGGLFCQDNSNCGADTCCFLAFCVPGTPVGPKLCFPD